MDNQKKNNQNPNNKNNKQGFSFIILVTLITSILVMALYQFQGEGAESEITYDKMCIRDRHNCNQIKKYWLLNQIFSLAA